jgi:hypothetical protein
MFFASQVFSESRRIFVQVEVVLPHFGTAWNGSGEMVNAASRVPAILNQSTRNLLKSCLETIGF